MPEVLEHLEPPESVTGNALGSRPSTGGMQVSRARVTAAVGPPRHRDRGLPPPHRATPRFESDPPPRRGAFEGVSLMRVHVLEPTLAGRRFEVPPNPQPPRSVAHLAVWTTFAVVALLLMDVLDLTVYGVVIPVAGVLLALVMARIGPPNPSIAWAQLVVDRADVIAIVALYVVTVGLFRLAFGVFGTDRVVGLFLSFAAALLVGVVGSVVYTTWIRRRPLASIGIGPQNLRSTLRLGLLLAAVQFSITLWGYDLPEPIDWVPLLVMAITVGLFEAIFFRGFIQGRLEASFGVAPAVLGAAALYALYHVGYGMDARRDGLPLRSGRRVRDRLSADRERARPVAAADPHGLLLRAARLGGSGRRAPLGLDRRLRRRARGHGARCLVRASVRASAPHPSLLPNQVQGRVPRKDG